MNYKQKNEAELAWLDNRDQVKLDIRKLARRLENVAMAAVYERYIEALNKGEILELRPAVEELQKILLDTAQRELSA